jgi:lactate permease
MVVMVLSILLTLLPIFVIVLLMTWKQLAADLSGLVGWFLTFLIAILFFHTSLEVGLRASLAGLIASFPVSLMVLVSILQITFMESIGAIKRITVFVKTLACSDKSVQIMMISVGAGTLLVSVGATPVSVLPPILVSLGYSTFVAIALPALGFDALCTFSLLGAPLVVYSDLTGVSLVKAAQVFAVYLPVISTLIGFAMLWLVGGFKLMKEGFLPALIAGLTNGGVAVAIGYIPFLSSGVVLTGVIAGSCTICSMLVYLKLQGKPVIDRSHLTEKDLKIEQEMSLMKAVLPWLILVALLLVVNFCRPLQEFFFTKMEMAISVIPGQIIKTRMLWNAYTWVLVSTIAAALVLKPTVKQISYTVSKGLKRGIRPFFSAAIFFAIGFVMNNTGLVDVGGTWQVVKPDDNMIWVLAQGSAVFIGNLYPLIVAPLGLFGGFISGSEASTVAMFAKYNLITADLLKVNPLTVTAATAIGGGLASVISPAKLQNAAATIDALGEETKVIKSAFIISLIITSVTAIMCFIIA